MRKWWSLAKIFMKTIIGSSMTIKIRGKESKWAGIALWILVAAFFIPVLYSVYFMMGQIMALFYAIGQLPSGVGFALNMGAIMIFIFSLLAAPAVFYFAKDVEYLLPLPVKPEQIIGAKFAVALAFEYVLALALMVVMYVVLLDFSPAGVLTFNTIITLVTLPILPMVYSTIFVMLLMRFTRFIRNPDRYTLFVGVLAIALAVGFSLYAGQTLVDTDAIFEAAMGAPVVMTTLNTVFISNGFAAQAFGAETIWGGALHNQLLSVLFAGVGLGVFFLLAKALYFAGVIGLSESGAPAKKMTAEEIAQNVQGQSKFRAYLIKELRLVFRSPTAFLNCVLAGLVMPVMLLISLVTLIRSGELAIFIEALDFSNPQVAVMVFTGLCALGIMMGGLVSTTSTSISREGSNLFIMKYLPVSYTTQLNAKAASGLVVLLPVILFMIIPAQIVFRAPLWLFAGGLLLCLLGAIFVNYFSLFVDLMRPKLTWDNEQAAVKNNMNVIVMMFGTMGVAGGIIALGMFVLNGALLTFVALFVVSAALVWLAYHLAIVKGRKLLEKLH